MKGRPLRDICLADWFDMEARDFDRDFNRLQREQEQLDDCLSWPSEPWGQAPTEGEAA